MSEAFEDRLRTHLAERASRVSADPDVDGLIQRSAGRHRRRGSIVAAATLVVLLAGGGILTGVNLAGTGSTASSSRSSAAAPNRPFPGSAAPSGGAGPAIAGQMALTSLFTRTTPSGVTIRVYTVRAAIGPSCGDTGSCPSVGTVPVPIPCPRGAMCAQPMIPAPTPKTTPSIPPEGAGSGTPGTAPANPVASCGQLVIELSTDRAVATGSTPWPTTAPSTPDTMTVLGTGSFGVAEEGPVSWVAVWAGADVTAVHLSSSSSVTDTMAPSSGIAVLAQPDGSGLAGADIVGTGQGGATVATVPADQASGGSACDLPASPPTTITTTTTTSTTTTTTTSTTEPGPATTTPQPATSTTMVPPGVRASLPPGG